jgi:hypothetical protein
MNDGGATAGGGGGGSPATGLWEHAGKVAREEVIAIEVMVGRLDKAWWKSYRGHLQADLKQERILIRSRS